MFKHQGKTRTNRHNLAIASLLSFVAGMVNVVGYLSIAQLTTNVTGHFALLMEELLGWNLVKVITYFLYLLFFLLGSFVSNLMVEFRMRKNEKLIFIPPVLTEAMLLLLAALAGSWLISNYPNLLAYLLLFAMGMQNSLVTSLSNATVRTTHLTGLFTDLGIELSQLFFYKKEAQQHRLRSSIRLRLTIIGFFFLGGILGGLPFEYMGIRILLVAVVILLAGLWYDAIKFKVLLTQRKLQAVRSHKG